MVPFTQGVEDTIGLFEKGPVILFQWKNAPGWPVEYVSANVYNLLGYSPEDFMSGKVVYSSLIHGADVSRVSGEVSDHSEKMDEHYEHVPYRLRRKSGEYIWVLDHSRLIIDAEGKIASYFGYLIDITDHQNMVINLKNMKEDLEKYVERRTHDLKQANSNLEIEIHNHSLAEKALQDSIRRFEFIINQTPMIAMQGFDQGGYISYWNKTSETLYGISSDDAQGLRIQDIISAGIDRNSFLDTLDELAESKQPTVAQYIEITREKNEIRNLYTIIYPIIDQGEVTEFFKMDIDITEQNKYQSEIKKVNVFLDSIMNTIADPIFVKDSHHKWVLLNDAFCKFMGLERSELIGKSDYDFFPKEEADVFWEIDNKVYQTGEPIVNVEDFTDSLNNLHVISTKKTLFKDTVTGEKILVGIIRDITEFKRLELELSKHRDEMMQLVEEKTADLKRINEELRKEVDERIHSEKIASEETEKLKAVLENSIIGVFITDREGSYQYINRRAKSLFGYSVAELKKKSFFDLTFKDDLEDSRKKYKMMQDGKIRNFNLEKRYVRKDGTVFWGEVYISAVHDENGEILSIIKLIRDIDRKKMNEMKIIEHDRFLENLLDSIPIPVYYYDQDGKFIGCNSAFEQFTNIKRKACVDQKIDAFHFPETQLPLDKSKDRKGKAKSTPIETSMVDSDGVLRHLILCRRRFTDREDNPAGVIATMMDITERKEAEEKLQTSYQELKEAQKSIRDLERRTTALAMAATANHEINQPLMVIQGNLDLIKIKLNEESDAKRSNGELKKMLGPYLDRIEDSMKVITGILTKFSESTNVYIDTYDDDSDMIVFEGKKE